MRLGELEGIVGEEDGYSAESDAAILLAGPRHPGRSAARAQDGASCRAARRCACCSRRRCSAIRRRCCSTSRRTTSTSTRSTGCSEFLERYDGTLIVISHDRHFLNARVHAHRRHRLPDDHHLHRRLRRHGAWPRRRSGRASSPRTRSARRRSRSCKDFIARFGGRHARQPGRRRAARKWSACRPPSWRGRTSSVRSSGSRWSGRRAASRSNAQDVAKAYGDLKVIKGFDAVINRGEKIVLVGRNGVGKTTLLKALLADSPNLQRHAGRSSTPATLRWGHEVSIGYFPQDHTGLIEARA